MSKNTETPVTVEAVVAQAAEEKLVTVPSQEKPKTSVDEFIQGTKETGRLTASQAKRAIKMLQDDRYTLEEVADSLGVAVSMVKDAVEMYEDKPKLKVVEEPAKFKATLTIGDDVQEFETYGAMFKGLARGLARSKKVKRAAAVGVAAGLVVVGYAKFIAKKNIEVSVEQEEHEFDVAATEADDNA